MPQPRARQVSQWLRRFANRKKQNIDRAAERGSKDGGTNPEAQGGVQRIGSLNQTILEPWRTAKQDLGGWAQDPGNGGLVRERSGRIRRKIEMPQNRRKYPLIQLSALNVFLGVQTVWWSIILCLHLVSCFTRMVIYGFLFHSNGDLRIPVAKY